MTITTEQIQGLTGKVYSHNSDKVGGIGQIYVDDSTGAPSWVTVKTGLFGSAETFVPLEGARVDGDDLHVNFAEDKIKNAPQIDPDGSLTPDEEEQLYVYYDLSDGDTDRYDTDRGRTHRDATSTGNPAPAGDHDDRTNGRDSQGDVNAMTRSEERVSVGTASREAGRARLRKYVTTETVTETVPVRHEEVTLEREPITDPHAVAGSGQISEEEHEVVLHEEVPVVDKDVVAVEQVKLGKETVTEDVTVSEDVRSEQIEMVDPDDTTGR